MLSNEEEEKKFQIIKYWVDNELSNKKCFIDEAYFFRACKNPELSNSKVLFGYIKKDVEELNSKIESRRTLLKNMRYKSKYLSSNVFNGLKIPEMKIENLMKENPTKNSYEIYRLIVGNGSSNSYYSESVDFIQVGVDREW